MAELSLEIALKMVGIIASVALFLYVLFRAIRTK